MQISKSSLPATLLPLLLLPGSSLATVADRSSCVHSGAVKFSAAAACGDKGSLEYCFQRVPEYVEIGDLERCFRNAGCTNAEAGIEATFLLHSCGNEQSVAELRRRSPEALPAPNPADTTTATSTDTSTATGTTSSSLQCSTATTTSTSSCPVQSTGTASGSTLSCFETTVTTSVCAAANICLTDDSGNDVCLLRDDHLSTSELIITIFLGVCFAAGFATLIFFACRDKRAQRKLRAMKQAADIAKTNAVNATSATAAVAPVEQSAFPAKRDVSPAPGNPFTDGSRY